MFAHFLVTLCPKHLPQKLSRTCTLHLRRSLCRRHLSDIAFTSLPSMSPCAYYISLLVYHSIFRKNLLLPCYHVFHYPVSCLPLPCTMSSITLYHVSYYSVSCLPLPCYHVSYYPVSCLPLLCYHVSYYPVSIKECKTTKKELTS